MTMSKKTFLYSFCSFILSPIYKFYYNPKIIRKNNLNVSGSKVITLNHIHLFDQCNIIISTKEFITFLAKKEYFDSPKTRWFFKSVGCIPVDRSKREESAKNRALKVLASSKAIGIFPEGTRNSVKKEYAEYLYHQYEIKDDLKDFTKKMKNVKKSQVDKMINLLNSKLIKLIDFKNNILSPDEFLKSLVKKKIITKYEYYDSYILEFKFGAVSMAKKEDAYLIPVGITGDYKFRSRNLTIRIGVPFKITNMDIEDANQILREKVLELIKENLN